jgi:hypothetical protein
MKQTLFSKWVWFVGLWLASVVALGIVAWVIRLAI